MRMKKVYADANRDLQQKTIYEGNGFSYEYIVDYPRNLPPEVANGCIPGGCVGPDDTLYVVVRAKESMIAVIGADGNFVKCIGKGQLGNNVHFVYYTPQNTLLVADTNHHVVRELTLEGEFVRDFGQYDHPSQAGMDVGYCARARRHALYPTEPSTPMPMTWMFVEAAKRRNRLGEPFNMPTDVGMTSKGEHIFTDGYGNSAVHRFDASGNYVKTWGGEGVWDVDTEAPGKFIIVHSLVVDKNDHIWVCEREKDAVHVFDVEGNCLAYIIHNLGQPSGVDTDGRYVYVIGRAGYLTIFDLEYNIVAQLGTFNSDLRAHDICVNSKGDLYLFPTHANEDHQFIQLKVNRK